MLALAIILTYVAMGLLGARNRYRLLRPLKEPLNCKKEILCNYGRGPHYKSGSYRPCYRSPLGEKLYIDGEGEAVVFALGMGLGWPIIFACIALKWAVTAGNHREQPAELDARIKDLERELGMDR